MSTKVEAVVIDGYRLTVHNECNGYIEDCWSLSFTGTTREELILKASVLLARSDIWIGDVCLERVRYLRFDEWDFVLESRDKFDNVISEWPKVDPGGIIDDIKATPEYKSLREIYLAETAAEEAAKELKEQQRREEYERNWLAALKGKYEGAD